MRVLKQKVPFVFAAVYHQKRCGLRPLQLRMSQQQGKKGMEKAGREFTD